MKYPETPKDLAGKELFAWINETFKSRTPIGKMFTKSREPYSGVGQLASELASKMCSEWLRNREAIFHRGDIEYALDESETHLAVGNANLERAVERIADALHKKLGYDDAKRREFLWELQRRLYTCIILTVDEATEGVLNRYSNVQITRNDFFGKREAA